MFSHTNQDGILSVFFNQMKILEHTAEHPVLMLQRNNATIDMYRGNYFIDENVEETLVLDTCTISEAYIEGRGVCILHFSGGLYHLTCELSEQDGRLIMRFSPLPEPYNRLILHIFAEEREHIWGCGEQFSCFDLRGRNYPLWTQEQGVGRNKHTHITQIADERDRAGGDYHTTFYPQTTFVSSRGYFLHANTDGYADFDFSQDHVHRLLFWEVPSSLVISVKPSLLEVVQDISSLLGRQPLLPDWVYDGIILGIQGGTKVLLDKLASMEAFSTPVNGIWIQDWQGEKYTSFGKRLCWNWQWDKELYPGLDGVIDSLKERGIGVLGYINPYVLKDYPLFTEAAGKGYLGMNSQGEPYLVDFGEFDAGVVDFTNPEAVQWYEKVIQDEMISLGLRGWMADFGEYLPHDIMLHNGRSALLEHNPWPGYWAQVNKQAIAKAGKSNEILYFMRSGSALSLSSCPMMWAGDQNVDWSEDDGLPSALCAALSLSMSGMGLHHSDIGGYTTLYGMKRSKELLLRWCEFAAFTPLMRTHEGNRPAENWQFDSDEETIQFFARMTRLHVALKPYLKEVVRENAEQGIPVMRPLFLHYPEEAFFNNKDSYLLGRDLLVAPVLKEGVESRELVLPSGRWVHLFTKERFQGGSCCVDAPLGMPPVFFREESAFASLFHSISTGMELQP
ncbi:MAG: alpha-glucosidase [Sphaerochaeta sp.]|nr:alpha-glucosidase [Sphaerochaeta sp.]